MHKYKLNPGFTSPGESHKQSLIASPKTTKRLCKGFIARRRNQHNSASSKEDQKASELHVASSRADKGLDLDTGDVMAVNVAFQLDQSGRSPSIYQTFIEHMVSPQQSAFPADTVLWALR